MLFGFEGLERDKEIRGDLVKKRKKMNTSIVTILSVGLVCYLIPKNSIILEILNS